MGGIALRAVLCYAAAFLLGFAISWLVFRRKARKASQHVKAAEIGVMDKVLIIEAIAIILYVTADLFVFWHTGSEPSTLTMSFFAVCGGENGFMAWIKTRKEQERMRKWQLEDQEKPEEYKEDKGM